MSQQQPDDNAPSPALDSLYEALTEVQAHLGEHHKERQGLLNQIEQAQRDLQEQRQKAAQAGERDTYERLSEDLAKLTRAYRVASEDPDADPLDEYQYDDSEPAAPTTPAAPTAPSTDRDDAERPAIESEPPTAGDEPTTEPESASATAPADDEADTGEAPAVEESPKARPGTGSEPEATDRNSASQQD